MSIINETKTTLLNHVTRRTATKSSLVKGEKCMNLLHSRCRIYPIRLYCTRLGHGNIAAMPH